MQHTAGNKEAAQELAQELAAKHPENGNVQVLCGTVLHANGQSEEALGLLARHQGDLEAYVAESFAASRSMIREGRLSAC